MTEKLWTPDSDVPTPSAVGLISYSAVQGPINGSAITYPLPTGTTLNDLMLVADHNESGTTGQSWTVQSGWTLAASVDTYCALWWKTRQPSEPACTITAGPNSPYHGGQSIGFRGQKASWGGVPHNTATASGGSGTIPLPTLTMDGDGYAWVVVGSQGVTSTWPPPGWTNTGGTGVNAFFYAAYRAAAQGETVGGESVTWSAGGPYSVYIIIVGVTTDPRGAGLAMLL
jgi:hypothetical protein